MIIIYFIIILAPPAISNSWFIKNRLKHLVSVYIPLSLHCKVDVIKSLLSAIYYTLSQCLFLRFHNTFTSREEKKKKVFFSRTYLHQQTGKTSPALGRPWIRYGLRCAYRFASFRVRRDERDWSDEINVGCWSGTQLRKVVPARTHAATFDRGATFGGFVLKRERGSEQRNSSDQGHKTTVQQVSWLVRLCVNLFFFPCSTLKRSFAPEKRYCSATL